MKQELQHNDANGSGSLSRFETPPSRKAAPRPIYLPPQNWIFILNGGQKNTCPIHGKIVLIQELYVFTKHVVGSLAINKQNISRDEDKSTIQKEARQRISVTSTGYQTYCVLSQN